MVSIIIPVYNGEKRIGKTLKFLEKQSDKDFEVVVVNDGSTDKTQRVLNTIRLNYPIKVIRNEVNRGRAATKNKGVKSAKGEIILFLDDDIFLNCHAVTLIKKFIEDKKNIENPFSPHYCRRDSC